MFCCCLGRKAAFFASPYRILGDTISTANKEPKSQGLKTHTHSPPVADFQTPRPESYPARLFLPNMDKRHQRIGVDLCYHRKSLLPQGPLPVCANVASGTATAQTKPLKRRSFSYFHLLSGVSFPCEKHYFFARADSFCPFLPLVPCLGSLIAEIACPKEADSCAKLQ